MYYARALIHSFIGLNSHYYSKASICPSFLFLITRLHIDLFSIALIPSHIFHAYLLAPTLYKSTSRPSPSLPKSTSSTVAGSKFDNGERHQQKVPVSQALKQYMPNRSTLPSTSQHMQSPSGHPAFPQESSQFTDANSTRFETKAVPRKGLLQMGDPISQRKGSSSAATSMSSCHHISLCPSSTNSDATHKSSIGQQSIYLARQNANDGEFRPLGSNKRPSSARLGGTVYCDTQARASQQSLNNFHSPSHPNTLSSRCENPSTSSKFQWQTPHPPMSQKPPIRRTSDVRATKRDDQALHTGDSNEYHLMKTLELENPSFERIIEDRQIQPHKFAERMYRQEQLDIKPQQKEESRTLEFAWEGANMADCKLTPEGLQLDKQIMQQAQQLQQFQESCPTQLSIYKLVLEAQQHRTQIQQQARELEERDAHIQRLELKIQQYDTQISVHQHRLYQLQGEIQLRDLRIQKLESELENRTGQIKIREQELCQLYHHRLQLDAELHDLRLKHEQHVKQAHVALESRLQLQHQHDSETRGSSANLSFQKSESSPLFTQTGQHHQWPRSISPVTDISSQNFPTPAEVTRKWKSFASAVSEILGDASLPAITCRNLSWTMIEVMEEMANNVLCMMLSRMGTAMGMALSYITAIKMVRQQYNLEIGLDNMGEGMVRKALRRLAILLKDGFTDRLNILQELIDTVVEHRDIFLIIRITNFLDEFTPVKETVSEGKTASDSISTKTDGLVDPPNNSISTDFAAPLSFAARFSLHWHEKVEMYHQSMYPFMLYKHLERMRAAVNRQLILVFPELHCHFSDGREVIAHRGLFSADV